MRLDTLGTGATLRQERLKRGISLEDIASRTRISQRFLEAIEAEDFARLPGLVFVRNFVRQFAAALAMDAEPLLATLPKLDIESVPLPNPVQFAHPRRRDPRWAAAFSSFMWLALAAGASIGGYFYLNREQPARPPNDTSVTVAPPLVSQSPKPGSPTESPAVVSPDAPSAGPAIAADIANHPVQVVLKARETSWVQVIADGKNAFTGILNPNDSREVEADALIKVTAGNAGGLEISLNGKSLDPLGPSGQVRTVRLTAEGPQTSPKTASSAL